MSRYLFFLQFQTQLHVGGNCYRGASCYAIQKRQTASGKNYFAKIMTRAFCKCTFGIELSTIIIYNFSNPLQYFIF